MKTRVHESEAVEELWILQHMAYRSKSLSMSSKLAASLRLSCRSKSPTLATDIVHKARGQLAGYKSQKLQRELTEGQRLIRFHSG